MFQTNVGGIDRVIRIVAGIALLVAFYFSSQTGWAYLYLLGIVPLLTGIFGTCPLYSILGINTCGAKRA